MDKNSNIYTFVFAIVMVTLIAGLLSYTATSLKPLQEKNVKAEKMQKILSTIGVEVSREEAEASFATFIKGQLALKEDGTVDAASNAFELSLKKEVKKETVDQRFPTLCRRKRRKDILCDSFVRCGTLGCHLGLYRLGRRQEHHHWCQL
jgi:Na+-transporting NADH:ubiquinone oxidoreductase subunit C